MSTIEQQGSRDPVTPAARLAIARARQRGSDLVTPDDLLDGLLRCAARFGVVLLGPWIIDLEKLDEAPIEGVEANGPKVAYADETAAIFDRAAAVARRDGSPHVEIVHMLVAFADEEGGLMGRLKRSHDIDSATWRASLARWSPPRTGFGGMNPPPPSGGPGILRELLSPDEAADLLGVHTQTVRGYMRSGKLPAHRLAGERVLRIRKSDLLALLEPYQPE